VLGFRSGLIGTLVGKFCHFARLCNQVDNLDRAMILLVEPDTKLRNMLARMLCSSGFPVRTAADAFEGLTLARECPPRLLVASENPGEMTNSDLRRALHLEPGLHALPLVFYSSGDLTSREPWLDLLQRVEQAYYEAPSVLAPDAMPLTYRPFARL
jgi:CheY-like chemotaxis protein